MTLAKQCRVVHTGWPMSDTRGRSLLRLSVPAWVFVDLLTSSVASARRITSVLRVALWSFSVAAASTTPFVSISSPCIVLAYVQTTKKKDEVRKM